ncbi:MAG: inositol monophosphatase [Proteobacteria bacterium]|nr:inositol monophosphatase [Pseudomonadota bacterium]
MSDPIADLLIRAGRAVASRAGDDRLTFRDKAAGQAGGADLVTECDLLVDSLVTDGLAALVPGVPVVSEERPAPAEAGTGDVFVLDPVDGTHNFASGVPWWGISLGRVSGAELREAWLLEPATGRLYHATADGPATVDGAPIHVTGKPPQHSLLSVALFRELLPLLLASDRFVGTRAMGCASLGLAYAAEGRFALHAARNHPWDVAAGYLLVERSGGKVVNLAGEPVSIWERVPSLAGAPQAVDLALEILAAP